MEDKASPIATVNKDGWISGLMVAVSCGISRFLNGFKNSQGNPKANSKYWDE